MASLSEDLLQAKRPVSPAPSDVSLKSDRSKDDTLNFREGKPRPVSPAFSVFSLKSDWSKDDTLNFREGKLRNNGPVSPASSDGSLKSDRSRDELRSESQKQISNNLSKENHHRVTSSRNLEKDPLSKLKAGQRKRILKEHEEQVQQHEMETELYEIGKNNKSTRTEYSDLFNDMDEKVRTVLTKEKSGVDKTFHTKTFMVDWAKGESNDDIDLIVSVTFSELNSREEAQSMEDFLNQYLTNEELDVFIYDKCKIAFILDGLEECELPLDFKKNNELTDLTKAASMDVLLTNLIKGNLLPSARLWIISQPSGVKKIPHEYIQKQTECRVMDDQQKLKDNLKKEFLRKYEKVFKDNTELYEIEKNMNYKQKLVAKKYNDIFKSKEENIKTVFTIDLSHSGKTSTPAKKFMVKWAKGKSNKDIDLIVSLNFTELNSRKEDRSMKDFLNQYLTVNKNQGVSIYDKCKIAFILDGLEECELPLDFKKNNELTDLTKAASMDVLLTNLIKGNLLPSAQLWIISQPSGVKKIPHEYIQKIMECREKDAMSKVTQAVKERILKENQSQPQLDSELYKIKTDNDKREEHTALNNYDGLFKLPKEARTVLTKGVAGIGKTFQAKRFLVDWAKEKSNKDINLIVSLNFNDLNSGKFQSIEGLLNQYFSDFKEGVWNSSECTLVFILDGLEECKLHLDFKNTKELNDLREAASMDVLLTNLIKGNLLPSDRVWIISRPSGVEMIPPEYIQRVTGCRETLKRRQQLVSNLRTRFRSEYCQVEDSTHPNQKNTEHIIREDVNDQAKSKKTSKQPVNSMSDIFKDVNGKPVRVVLTTGEADIGKTFYMKKFIKDWAENKSSVIGWFKEMIFGKEEDVTFPLNLTKLNAVKDKVSLVEVLNYFFEETRKSVIADFAKFKVLFVLDGLEALKLDFDGNETLTDVRDPASVNVLLINLIKGTLLPTARLWITSRPSAADLLPPEAVDRRTEIREKPDVASKRKLKSDLKDQFTRVSEGFGQQKTSALLNDIFTDLYIIEGERGEVNTQSETRQVQDAKFKPEETPIKYHDIFKTQSEGEHIRTVLTLGMAGIGKTFASMKYVLDWAEDKAHKDTYYTFPLPFRELNLRKGTNHSFEEIINQFFPVMETSEITDYNKYNILIVLDGFDECRLDLDFNESVVVSDMTEQASVKVLLQNLIQGNLLPKAQIWITSRPAASNNIPAENVDRVTEVRGFNDEQKEEYFRKRFSDTDMAEKVLEHVKKSRSLHIMCHIPVFCWITSEVLEDLVKRNQEEAMPKTLTDMYIHLLLLQCRQANAKYSGDDEGSETDVCWNERNKKTVLSLAKLAFEELQKDGNLLFTKENLVEYEVNMEEAAVFSGLFTQVKREGRGLYQQKLFCFAHMSIQEFLAAVYASHMFNNKDENNLPASEFYSTWVNKALDSDSGKWDLFLRFLLGLSLETNQELLQDLLKKSENTKETNKKTIEFIKEKLKEENRNADKNLNLFYCLNELNDHSLVREVKKYLQSESTPFNKFSAAQWSALTFVLLTSDKNLDVFDLKKYLKSEKVLLGLLPVVKVSKTTLLSWCELSEESCRGLKSSVLTSASSNLTELDMSHNDLLDSGVQLLAEGFRSLHCKLEVLKLAGCQVTERGCSFLAEALKSNRALKLLDLSYNHPEGNGMKELNEVLSFLPSFEHSGAHRLKPGMKKYSPNLRFDENTASKRLVLSEENRKVRTVKKVTEKTSRPNNDSRFNRSQILCDCDGGLNEICYWEVEWRGTVGIAVTYEDVGRRWDRSGGLGCNENSWSLLCSKDGCKALHGRSSTDLQKTENHKIGVFLDWEGGILRYYDVSSAERILIHEFKATFTKPLFPGFWFKSGSVTLLL